jgi:hypothetical protein
MVRSPNDLEVRVIMLTPSDHGMRDVRSVFPDAAPFQARDRRGVNPETLYAEGAITENALETMKRGRKWHHEISGPGGVGLHESMRDLLRESDGPVLICEEDCVPRRELASVVVKFLSNADEFDAVVFGPIHVEQRPSKVEEEGENEFLGFKKLNSYFWGLHAVLYSREGRRKIGRLLQDPVDVQMDALLSRAAMHRGMRILVQTKPPALARQRHHVSSIQSDILGGCDLCEANPVSPLHAAVLDHRRQIVYLVIMLAAITTVYLVFRRMIHCECPKRVKGVGKAASR